MFSTIWSAKAICSRASLESARRSSTCLASTTVVTESSLVLARTSSSMKKVWATGAGSARPVVSITMAPIHRATRSDVPLETVLGRGGFDLDRILELEPEFLNPGHGEPGHVHDEHCDDDHGHDHDHHDHGHVLDDISGVSLKLDRPVDGDKVTRWLNETLQAQGPDILRAKGILDVKGEERRLVFQAVHMLLEGDFQRTWRDDEARYSRMVFIGRNLDEAALKRGFEACAG